MKTIYRVFILVVFLLMLKCSLSSAQSADTVCIKSTTADYFLEADDERYLLRDKVIILERDNKRAAEKILQYRTIATSYQAEELVWGEEYMLLFDEYNKQEIKLADKDHTIKKIKIERWVERGAFVLFLILVL